VDIVSTWDVPPTIVLGVRRCLVTALPRRSVQVRLERPTGRRERELADVGVVRVGVVDEEGFELVGLVLGHVPHGLDRVEEALLVHVGHLLEHRAVLEVVTIDDGSAGRPCQGLVFL
jgi:hypothetical protein